MTFTPDPAPVEVAALRDDWPDPDRHEEHAVIHRLLDEIETLRATVAQVEALHRRRPHRLGDFVAHGQSEFPDLCDHCRSRWPCATARATGNQGAPAVAVGDRYLDVLESMHPSPNLQAIIDRVRAEDRATRHSSPATGPTTGTAPLSEAHDG